MAGELDLSAASDAAANSDQNAAAAATSAAASQASAVGDGGQADAGASQAAAASQQTQAAGSQQQQQQAEWNLRNELQGLGFQGQYQDDRSAWQALAGQLRQQQAEYARAQQIASYYLANQQTIQQALAAQQGAAQKPAAQPAKSGDEWWTVPEWNDQWNQFLRTDDKGNVTAVLGADPSLPLKYQQHQQWQRETFQKLMRDPIGTLKPGLEKVIEAKTQEMIQKHLRGYDDRQFASQYVSQQADWMYAKTQGGQPAFDTFGQRLLSPAGQKFAGYVQVAEKLGITDTRQQQSYAENMTQRDALVAFYQQHNQGGVQGGQQQQVAGSPDQQNQALKDQAIRGGSRRIPGSGAQGGAGPAARPGEQQAQDIRLSLGARLSKRLKEAGIESVN